MTFLKIGEMIIYGEKVEWGYDIRKDTAFLEIRGQQDKAAILYDLCNWPRWTKTQKIEELIKKNTKTIEGIETILAPDGMYYGQYDGKILTYNEKRAYFAIKTEKQSGIGYTINEALKNFELAKTIKNYCGVPISHLVVSPDTLNPQSDKKTVIIYFKIKDKEIIQYFFDVKAANNRLVLPKNHDNPKIHFVINCRHIYASPTNCKFIKDMSENHPTVEETDEKHLKVRLGKNEYIAKRIDKCSYKVV